jgi:hypothetical protein
MIARGFSDVIQLTNDWLFHRTFIFVISALVLVTLVGCRTGATASPIAPPTAIQTFPSPVAVEPTLLSPVTTTPTIENRFSIYLLAQNISPEQLAILCHLGLENKPVLSITEISRERFSGASRPDTFQGGDDGGRHANCSVYTPSSHSI